MLDVLHIYSPGGHTDHTCAQDRNRNRTINRPPKLNLIRACHHPRHFSTTIPWKLLRIRTWASRNAQAPCIIPTVTYSHIRTPNAPTIFLRPRLVSSYGADPGPGPGPRWYQPSPKQAASTLRLHKRSRTSSGKPIALPPPPQTWKLSAFKRCLHQSQYPLLWLNWWCKNHIWASTVDCNWFASHNCAVIVQHILSYLGELIRRPEQQTNLFTLLLAAHLAAMIGQHQVVRRPWALDLAQTCATQIVAHFSPDSLGQVYPITRVPVLQNPSPLSRRAGDVATPKLHPQVFAQILRCAHESGMAWPTLQDFYRTAIDLQMFQRGDAGFGMMLRLCFHHRDAAMVDTVLHDMKALAVIPRPSDLYRTMQFLCQINDVARAQRVFTLAQERKQAHKFTEAIHVLMIKLYGQSRARLPLCIKVYESLLDWQITPQIRTFIALANAFANHGDIRRTMAVVKRLEDANIKQNPYVATTLLKAYYNQGSIATIVPLFFHLKNQGYVLNQVAYHFLIRAYAWENRLAAIPQTIQQMLAQKLPIDNHLYTFLLHTYIYASQWDECLKIVSNMRYYGVQPNIVTLGLLLSLVFQPTTQRVVTTILPSLQGFTTYASMVCQLRILNLQPNVHFITQLLQHLWRQGQWGQMVEIWEHVSQMGLKAHWGYFTSILANALTNQGLLDQAQEFLEYVDQIYPHQCQQRHVYAAWFHLCACQCNYAAFVSLFHRLLEHHVPINTWFVANVLGYLVQANQTHYLRQIQAMLATHCPQVNPPLALIQRFV
ncbi:hypothetical protein H4R34_001552 [Dimargaris verticillata]|uniref:Pentacotripeptide-repeat region of PRORP domain-containing protein n=1 Tax=Dimargaris verticillata TaxID=2761393 RepID=A0A9W8B481_9FUNG|nr:hypothetical protein H4R34_001552 [Dimargaris verticillata]